LSFNRGDIIINVRENEGTDSNLALLGQGQWLQGEINSRKGIFPLNYVEVTVPELPKLVAEYDFSPEGEEEIPLRVGEEIRLISISGDGWYRGRNEAGDVGLFPHNYVRFQERSWAN